MTKTCARVYGASVHKAMTDLIMLMYSLLNRKRKILIPGLGGAVAGVTEEELELYDKIDFDLESVPRTWGQRPCCTTARRTS